MLYGGFLDLELIMTQLYDTWIKIDCVLFYLMFIFLLYFYFGWRILLKQFLLTKGFFYILNTLHNIFFQHDRKFYGTKICNMIPLHAWLHKNRTKQTLLYIIIVKKVIVVKIKWLQPTHKVFFFSKICFNVIKKACLSLFIDSKLY